MMLIKTLLALAICLVSLVSATVFLSISPDSNALPALIAWVTVSAAIFYVLLCMAVTYYFRILEKRLDPATLRVPKRRPKSGFSIETDSNAGEPANHSESTFHWESESFRKVNELDKVAPRSPETVLHYPLRSSYLRLPALTIESLLTPTPRKSLPPTPPIEFDLPPVPFPPVDTPVAEVRSASRVTVCAVGKASEVRIITPPKAKSTSELARSDPATKIQETTKRMADGLSKGLGARTEWI